MYLRMITVNGREDLQSNGIEFKILSFSKVNYIFCNHIIWDIDQAIVRVKNSLMSHQNDF